MAVLDINGRLPRPTLYDLKQKVYAIRLLSVEKGCFKLIFAIPGYIVKATFPLSEQQESALAGLGILQLVCNDYRLKDTTSQVRQCGM